SVIAGRIDELALAHALTHFVDERLDVRTRTGCGGAAARRCRTIRVRERTLDLRERRAGRAELTRRGNVGLRLVQFVLRDQLTRLLGQLTGELANGLRNGRVRRVEAPGFEQRIAGIRVRRRDQPSGSHALAGLREQRGAAIADFLSLRQLESLTLARDLRIEEGEARVLRIDIARALDAHDRLLDAFREQRRFGAFEDFVRDGANTRERLGIVRIE